MNAAETKPLLLLVDDEPGNLKILFDLLKEDYRLRTATNGEKALGLAAAEEPPDLILLDVMMPGIDGYEVCRQLKENAVTMKIPVIFLTGKISEDDEVRGFEAGAVDYVTKPFSPVIVKARIHTQVTLKIYRDLLVKERAQADRLLLSILPANVAKELKENGTVAPVSFPNATVMFTDFVGFSQTTKKLTPLDLVTRLDSCFSLFDEISTKNSLERLKTIGDSYMCVGGVPVENGSHPLDCCLAALEIRSFIENKIRTSPPEGPFWNIRIGINTGSLIAGVVGQTKFIYDVWGDDVNTASRMEAAAATGGINIGESTWNLVKEYFDTEFQGIHEVKNGQKLPMYSLYRLKKEFSSDPMGTVPNQELRNRRRMLNEGTNAR